MTRDKTPSLRDQQQHLTRELILRALVDVVNEEGVHAFTVQRVADRAGVSHRTVYRHFPTRQAMLDGFGEWAEAYNQRQGLGLPEQIEDLPEHTKRIFETFDADADAVRAIILVRLVTGLQEQTRRDRTETFERMLREWAPNVDEAYRANALRAMRALVTAGSWYQMRMDFGVSGKAAGEAVAYAVKVILGDLRRRDDAAAKETGSAHPGDEA